MFGLSALALKFALFGGVLALVFAAGLRLENQLCEGKHAAEQQRAVAEAVATQKRFDDIALEAAHQEATQQRAVADSTAAQLLQVKRHVQNNPRCVTFGFVRVLDAATHGVLAETLSLPAGKSDAACTKLTANDLANAIVTNYGAARANAEQLNALIAVLRAMHQAR